MNKNFFVTRNDEKKIAVRMIEASKDNACPTIIFAHGLAGIPGRYCHMEKDSIRLALTVCFLISAEEDLSQKVMAVYRK